eukprot:m.165816 g.165816  ORF g.165816 m.165816 type:complete len:2014 (-) comp12609_c0_seq1:393-6434(-)
MFRAPVVAVAVVAAAALLRPVTGQLPARVTNSRGCGGFGRSCTINLEEGLDVMATLTLDEPIVCQGTDNFECSVIVNISNSHPHIVAVEPCYVRWTRTEWHQPRRVRITAVQNYRNVPGETHQIHLNAQVLSLASYYNNFDVEDFYIETRNRRTAQCRSTGDPHYTTFDGYRWHYYRASLVTLYRAPNRDFAVQTQTIGYPGRNCAVAARENRDRVIIDNCGTQLRVITDYHSNNTDEQPRVQVTGRTYTVYFYSGAWVRAQIAGRRYINVYTASVDATPSSAQPGIEYSCGLCGNFNGNRNDDAPGYRITQYDPLFPCMKVPSVATRPLDGATVTFGNIFNWTYNESDFRNTTAVVPVQGVANCPYEFQRIVRPIINTDDVEDITTALQQRAATANNNNNGFGFTFGNGNLGNVTTTPNYSVNQSRAACQRNIAASATVQRCAALYSAFNESLDNYTDDCTIDYSNSGGPGPVGDAFLSSSLRALEAQCLALAVQNNDTSLLPLQEVLCDNACSGRGACGRGARCNCTTGYGGPDCSIDLNAPPTILGASDIVYDSAGLYTNHTPREIVLTGINFLHSVNLTCRFNTTTATATYLGTTQIMCSVPALFHRGPAPVTVPLQVTNDGRHWSNATDAMFIYYDGTCQACNASGSCGPNPNSCIIGGQCYLPHATRPASSGGQQANPCQLCVPSVSTSSWTYDYTQNSCRPTFNQTIYSQEIVGAAVGGTPMLTINGRSNRLVNTDPNYRINYTYSSNLDSSFTPWFGVNASTGTVYLLRTVNMSDPVFMNMQHAADNPASFNGFFRVVATDQQGYTSTVDVSISLVPLTVHGAIFPVEGFSGVIPEGAATGTAVMTHPDANNQSVPLVVSPLPGSNLTVTLYEWFLQPQGAINALRIDNTTGAVTVQNGALLNYETQAHLSYRVRGTVVLQYITPLFVEVTDVHEPPTAVATSPADLTVAEGNRSVDFIANLSTVDGDATATSDGGPFTYTIVSGGSTFELRQWVAGVSSTTYLAVRSNIVLDYETMPAPRTLNVSIQTTDPDMLSVTTVLTVRVMDVNEAPTDVSVSALPSPPSGVTVTQTAASCDIVVPENLAMQTRVAQLTATDPDANAGRPQCFAVDPHGKFTQDISRNYMLLGNTLDFETTPSFTVAITCTDAVDYSLEATALCNVTVTDVAEAPYLLAYAYTGGAVNESEVRTQPRVMGLITVIDQDAGSSTTPIAFTPPSGYSVTNVACASRPTGALVCNGTLVLLPSASVSFGNSTRGVVSVPLTVSHDGLSRSIAVNITVEDQPELPTGMTLTLPGPLFENAAVGTVVARVTFNDPDSTPQNFSASLTQNPNGAFSIERVVGQPSAQWLKVANASAIDFVESLSGNRVRRQGGNNNNNNAIPFTVRVCEPAHPHLGCVEFSDSVTVTDRPLVPTTNSTILSRYPGDPVVQFMLQNQDIAELNPHLQWTLESTSMTTTMGSVSLSPSGQLSVTSPHGLCEDGGADAFLVTVAYSFASYGRPLPSGYEAARFQAELRMGPASSAIPIFPDVPPSGVAVAVTPNRGLTTLATSTVPINVTLPCGVEEAYTLSVVSSPVAVPAQGPLPTDVVVWDGTGYIRPASTGQLMSNLNAGVWQRSNVFAVPEAPTFASSTSSFGFRTVTGGSGAVNTGSPTDLRVEYRPSASPSLPYREGSYVLMAVVASTQRAALVNVTFDFLDACGKNVLGNEVSANTCDDEAVCMSVFTASGAWDYRCDEEEGSPASASESATGSVGLWIGIVLAAILVVLIALAVYFRHQKKVHEDWDGTDKRVLPTYRNPTYEAAGGLQGTAPPTNHDTSFRPGFANAMYEWYKPQMSRRECTDHLMAQGEGSFVVRDSDSIPGWHMLGVKTSNRVIHDKIRLTEDDTYQLLPSMVSDDEDTVEQPTFATLPELVEHYLAQGNDADVGYTLVDSNPIYDNHQLIQERTGQAVKVEYDEKLPTKKASSPVRGSNGPTAVTNPMYVHDASPPQKDAGYLDVEGENEPAFMHY